ncbi:BppU family phage baseplate upper protein [Macrococcus sp. EM39E]|uniref:BppU family phage baseplate upper protein n=1 Tax=Macrococcus animalis TaxID=3395467 RepID=UPI0039BDE7D9
MAIFKNKDIATDIRVTDVNVGNIGAKFYSEDENTASIGIYIKNNGQVLNLSTITMKPMLNLYCSDGSIFINEPLVTENATEGFVKYYVSKEVIKHVGTVNAKLFLESETESVHVANFSFDIGDSGTNKEVAKVIDIDIIGDKITEVITANAHLFQGEQGIQGEQGEKGEKGDGLQIDGVVATIGELPAGTTQLTYLVGSVLYFRNDGHSTWIKGTDIKGVDGKAGSIVSIGSDGYWYIDGIKTTTKADMSGEYALKTHTHTISDITNLQTQLDGKALSGHNHDLTYIKQIDGQMYKLFNDVGTVKVISGVDFNTPDSQVTKSGFYYAQAPINAPTGAVNGFVNYEILGNLGKVYYSPYNTNDVYLKTKISGTWGNWIKLNSSTTDMTGYDKTVTLDTKYAPITHTHDEYLTQSESDGLYSSKTHTHTPTEIGTYSKSEIDSKIATAQTGGTVDLSSYLKSADASTTYATKVHTHTIGDISNLQVTLDGKALAGHNHDTVYSKLGHTHAISDITNLQTTLNGKASTTHAHVISDVTNLQTTLDGKALTSHTHTASQVLMSDGTTVQAKIDSLPTSSGSGGTVSAPTWINATLSNGFTGTVKYCKDGFNIVTVNVDITVGSTTTLNTVVASLPQGYLPPMAYLPDLFYNSSTGQADAFFNVGNVFNGVTVAKGLQAGHNIRGQFMFRV